MKKLLAIVLAVVMLATLGGVALAAKPIGDDGYNGNGAPSGPHFNLNIIGVPHEKANQAEELNKWTSGNRIFVLLDDSGLVSPNKGKYGTKILLQESPEGESYAVLDANGTDGVASFQLPNPDPDMNGVTAYSVYLKVAGTPGGKATMQTCYTDDTGTWCAVDFPGGVEPLYLERTNGKQTFQNVSAQLLYIDYCAEWTLSPVVSFPGDIDPPYEADDYTCTDVDIYPLFGGPAEISEYFWDYDNNGLKLAQLRFYEIPTDTGYDVGAD